MTSSFIKTEESRSETRERKVDLTTPNTYLNGRQKLFCCRLTPPRILREYFQFYKTYHRLEGRSEDFSIIDFREPQRKDSCCCQINNQSQRYFTGRTSSLRQRESMCKETPLLKLSVSWFSRRPVPCLGLLYKRITIGGKYSVQHRLSQIFTTYSKKLVSFPD